MPIAWSSSTHRYTVAFAVVAFAVAALLAAASAATEPSSFGAGPGVLRKLEGLPTIVVDGSSCTLHDAILAANGGITVGGCVGSPGLEILSLEADVVASAHDATHSTLVGGAFAALPDVTSGIIIAAGAGSVIERATALGCQSQDPDSFRLVNVTPTGALYLLGLTLRNGCVAPGPGVASEGGAIHVDGGLLELEDVILEDNTVYGTGNGEPGATGGAVFCREGTLPSVFATTFRRDRVQGADGVVPAAAHGGAVRAEGCVIGTWQESLFEDCSAVGSSISAGAGRGGALSLDDTSADALEDMAFLSNLARGGDGIDTSGADAEGGAVHAGGGSIGRIVAATFSANQAIAGDSEAGDGGGGNGGSASGGALHLDGDLVVEEIGGNVFATNLAAGGDAPNQMLTRTLGGSNAGPAAGGALTIDGAVVAWLHDAWFDGNQAVGGIGFGSGQTEVAGGGIFVGGTLQTLERATLSHNVAEGRSASSVIVAGGALFIEGNAQRIVSSTFYANQALGADEIMLGAGSETSGGAMFLVGEAVDEIAANTVVGNEVRPALESGGPGPAFGGGLSLAGSGDGTPVVAAYGNLFADNHVLDFVGGATAEDCYGDEGGGSLEGGWNLLEAPGNCALLGTNDQVGVATETYALADWGCATTLAGGVCLPTVAIDQDSPAIDAGSCTAMEVAADAREVPRPFDFEPVADVDDGCDTGAFEAVDADGDGYSEAADCAPADPSAHAADICGVCGGDGSACTIFEDGFESGDTSVWDLG